VSNIIFDIRFFLMEGGLYEYPMKNILSCCGLEVQKPTQALQSVKGPGNTFD
jgi:hypothetical protein